MSKTSYILDFVQKNVAIYALFWVHLKISGISLV